MKDHLRVAPFGLLLGFTIGRLGFADYTQVRRMFTFADWRLTLAFVGAVMLSIGGFLLLGRNSTLARNPIHKGTIPGGLLFGGGWALTGCCPAVPLVQLGEGKLSGVVVIFGILAGIVIYRWVHERYFSFDHGSCAD